MRSLLAALVLAAIPGLARAETTRLDVSAAASLTDVLPKVAAAAGIDVSFNFDASSRLAAQITNGAPADLFFSADEEWMTDLQKRDLVDASSRIDLLTNELVVVVPAKSALTVQSVQDLSAKAVHHVALAGENVPAGRYARQSLTKLGVWASIADRVVNGSNVRQTLEFVARGEVDTAIVYRTDAAVEPRVKVVLTLPAGSHDPIVYPVAVVKAAAHPAEARRFLTFCRGDSARKLFEQAGFGTAGR